MNKMGAKFCYVVKSLVWHRGMGLLLVLVSIAGCAVIPSGEVTKIALVAPFEGRYREIGYNALYAVRLAMSEHTRNDIQLLAVDDGASIDSAVERIRALNNDPAVKAIIALGQFASHETVQQTNDKPLFIIGFWGQTHADENSLIVSSHEIENTINTLIDVTALESSTPLIGGDLLMLQQIPDLYKNTSHLTLLSSGAPPDAQFYDKYIHSDLYVPEPNLLATLTYDTTNMVLSALQSDTALSAMHYEGINGVMTFADGYWANAPFHQYRYDAGQLIRVD